MDLSQLKPSQRKFPFQKGIETYHFSPFALLWFSVTHIVTIIWLIPYASWENFIILSLLHLISGVGITLGAHRYFSHQTFVGPKWLENFLAIAYTYSFVRAGHGLIGWVASHRFHHAFVDQHLDPHTPRKGFWHAYAGHFIWRREDLWDFGQYKHYQPELAKNKFLVFLDKPSTVITLQVLISIFIVLMGGFTGKTSGFDTQHAVGYFVWLVCARYVYTQFSHSMAATVVHGTWPFQGLRDTFNTKSDAKNNLIYWGATLGNETWHNVHHAYPKIANNGPYWYHWDLDSFLMKLLGQLGIVHGLRFLTKEQYESSKNRQYFENHRGRLLFLPDTSYSYYANGNLMPASVYREIEAMAFKYGAYYDSYLATEPGREYFVAPNGKGFVNFYTIGKYVNVVGGLIAPEDQKTALLEAFYQFCKSNRLTVSFFGLLDGHLERFENLGFEITKLGEEFRVDLSKLDWTTPAFGKMRKQFSFARRQGLTVKELRRADYSEWDWKKIIDELITLEIGLLTTKPQARPTAVFQGHLENGELRQRRLFVAYGAKGSAEGFVICNPIKNGKNWAFETFRHRVDSVRGCVAYLFYMVMSQMKEEGCEEISLGMIPGIRCDLPRPGDSKLCRLVMNFWAKHLNFVADLKGIYHFKTRFRPRELPIYVCVYPKVTIGSTLAFLMTCGIIKVHPTRVFITIMRMFKNRRERQNLRRPLDVVESQT